MMGSVQRSTFIHRISLKKKRRNNPKMNEFLFESRKNQKIRSKTFFFIRSLSLFLLILFVSTQESIHFGLLIFHYLSQFFNRKSLTFKQRPNAKFWFHSRINLIEFQSENLDQRMITLNTKIEKIIVDDDRETVRIEILFLFWKQTNKAKIPCFSSKHFWLRFIQKLRKNPMIRFWSRMKR